MSLAAELSPQKEWMARSNLKFFERNKDAIRADTVILLVNAPVLRVLSRTWEPLSRDTHYITMIARSILADRVSGKIYQEEELFKAETAVAAQMDRVGEYLDRRIAQAEQRLRAAGYDPGKVPYRAKAYGAEVLTRTATDYLEVLKKADLYLVLVQYLWLTAELSDSPTEALKAKLNTERDVRANLLSIPRATLKHFEGIRRICGAVLEQRALDRQAQAARDRAKALGRKQRQASQGQPTAATTDLTVADVRRAVPGPTKDAQAGGEEPAVVATA